MPKGVHNCCVQFQRSALFCVLHAELRDILEIVEGSHGNRSSQTRVNCLG
jgi:hypothetical protein